MEIERHTHISSVSRVGPSVIHIIKHAALLLYCSFLCINDKSVMNVKCTFMNMFLYESVSCVCLMNLCCFVYMYE